MLQRLARSIVRRYPAPWRERYEEEVLALIDDSPLRLHDLGELTRGLIVERARALIEDADHPSRTATILSSLQPAFVITFVTAAWALGFKLRGWRGQLPDSLGEVGLFIVALLAAGTMIVALVSLRREAAGGRAGFPPWVGFCLMPLGFIGFVLFSWAGWPSSGASGLELAGWFRMVMWGFIYGNAASRMTESFWPGAKMLEAIGKLASADRQIKSAHLWIDGCETMIAKGVPSPLGAARAQLAEGERNRELALEQLQRLGYRARFQL